MKKFRLIVIAYFAISTFNCNSQTWTVSWEKEYGSPGKSYFSDIVEDRNGGFTVLGAIESDDTKSDALWLVRLNSSGDTLWDHEYDAPVTLMPEALVQSSDNGYLMVGSTRTKNNTNQAMLIKTSRDGAELWRKNIGDSSSCLANAVAPLNDGSFVLTGAKSTEQGHDNLWIIKIDPQGNTVWQKVLGGKDIALGKSIKHLPDGGFAVAGAINAIGKRGSDFWLLRTNQDGETIWQSRIRTPVARAWPESICCSTDSCLVVVGWYGTSLNGIDAENPVFDYDIAVRKLDRNGKVLWTKNIDSEGSEGGYNITVRPDGTYLIAGEKETSFAGNIGPWLLHLDANGKVLSENLIKFHFNHDQAYKIINCSDGGFAVIGPGEKADANYRGFGWVIKFNPVSF